MPNTIQMIALVLIATPLSGCLVTTVVGAAVDVAEDVVEIPVKAGEMAVHAVSSSSDDKQAKKSASTPTAAGSASSAQP